MEAEIAIGPGKHADQLHVADHVDPRLLLDLPRKRGRQRLAPLEGAARRGPGARVGAPHQEKAPLPISGDGGDTDDGSSEQVSTDLSEDPQSRLRKLQVHDACA